MAGKLKKTRIKFVNSVNRNVIDQLLDGLFDDVLNGGEKDSILEGNTITTDRARALIDTVMKKGDVASNKMIDLLQRIDPTLYAELGLSSENPAQPAAAPEPQLGQGGSGTLINSTEDFWKGKQGRSDTYPAAKESMRHRMALLITNIKFTDTSFDRAGADRDEKNMYKLLVALGYEVVKHTNLTGKEIDAAVIAFSKLEKLKETDSVVVVIMSHGKLGAIAGVDWKRDKPKNEEPDEFSIENIYLHLGPKGCPALLDKPKIILIQACRGDKKGSELVKDGLSRDNASHNAGHEDFEEDGLRFVNKEKDFLALLSCTPDTVSYRHPDHGSLLIQFFVAVSNASAHVDHIDELSRKVQQRFEDSKIKIQMPTKDRVTLTKHFYFFPGI